MTNKKRYIKCQYCSKQLLNDQEIISSHMLYQHTGVTKLKNKKQQEYSVWCHECNEQVASTQNGLALHLKSQHGVEYVDYIIAYEYNGVHPLCGCGCGKKLSWKKGKGFGEFIHGHNKRKRRKKAEPQNTPLPEIVLLADDSDTDNKEVHVKQESPVEEIEIKDGFVPQWKWNPAINTDEFINSRVEASFLDEQIKLNNMVTKHHEIEISYELKNGKKCIYRPNFINVNKSIIYDTETEKKLEDETLRAIDIWCQENGFAFRIIKNEI